jgi:hypothetical protein
VKFFLKEGQPRTEAGTQGIPSVEGARELVPASAKSPDAQRLMLFNPDDEIDESSDQDLAFLHALIEGGAPASTPPQPAAMRPDPTPVPEPELAPRGDDLDVFREMAALRQRVELAKHLRVDKVDIGDLLEELHTTRAALKHRKAA